jgi:hypothetical protein
MNAKLRPATSNTCVCSSSTVGFVPLRCGVPPVMPEKSTGFATAVPPCVTPFSMVCQKL